MRIENLKNRLIAKPSDRLGRKAIKSGFWMVMIRGGERFLGLVKNIVLARILAPTDFGLFGIALVTLSAFDKFTQTGFDSALIQKKDRPERYLDAAWSVNVLRGLFLSAFLFLLAPIVAGFFHELRAESMIRVLSLVLLLKGFRNIGVVYFKKELEFHKEFILRISSSLLELITALAVLFIYRSIWALVAGSLVGTMTNLLASYFLHPYRPRFRLDWPKIGELFNFGKWVFGYGILSFLLTEGDDVFLGRILGATSLGLYQMAYRISNLPATQIASLISQVTFPVYAKIQDQLKQLGRSYLKVLKLTTFLSFPFSFFIFFLAPDFTMIFLGDKWLLAVPAMQGLAIWGLVRSIGATTGPIFLAQGRPDIITKIQLAKLALLALLIYPLTIGYGMLGTVWAVVGSAVAVNPISDYLVVKSLGIKGGEFIKRLLFPGLAAIVSWFFLALLKGGLLCQTSLISFLILILVGSTSYLLIMAAFNRLGWYSIGLRAFIKRNIN